jgi:hypothetical protein
MFRPVMAIIGVLHQLTLNLLMTTRVPPPSNASKWQMGFNSSFKGLRSFYISLWGSADVEISIHQSPVCHCRMHTYKN